MKTIFIATDFSAASRNAVDYGIELAKSFKAELILFNAYQEMPIAVTETPVMNTIDDLKRNMEKNLEKEAKAIHAGNTITVETISREGPAGFTILEVAGEKRADLIIAGMKEGGKGVRKFFGGTVTALARNTTIPLIVIPEKTKYSPISAIALANESDLDPDADSHLLGSLQDIAARFHSRLYLVRVAKNRVKAAFETLNRPFRLMRMVNNLHPVYGSIEGKDIPEALNHFIEGYHIDILAMLPHKHSLLERWFVSGTTRSVVFKADIPLLILPDLHTS